MASEQNGKNGEIYIISATQSIPKKKDEAHNNFWSVNKEMLHFKIHYFLFAGGCGACLPYLIIFARNRVGISASALAAILTTQQFITIFSKPLIGYLADYFNKLKFIICTVSVLMTVFIFLLLTVPKIDKHAEKESLIKVEDTSIYYDLLNTTKAYVVCEFFQYNSTVSVNDLNFNSSKIDYIPFQLLNQDNFSDFLTQCSENEHYCLENEDIITSYENVFEQRIKTIDTPHSSQLCKACCKLTEQCQVIDCESLVHFTNMSIDKKSVSDFQTSQFWFYASLSTIAIICANSLFSLTDTACCESVQKTGSQFGRQKLWAAIGWGTISPLSGLLNDYTGDFLASWILMAVVSFLSVLNMVKLAIVKPQFSENLLKDIGDVLASKVFLAFAFCVLLNGIFTGIIWFYLILFLTDIGGSRFLCGLVNLVQGFSEIPFMFYSGWVIKKIGHFNVISLSLTAYIIRLFWYSQLQNPWLTLPVEVLHGITFGLFYTNVASFGKLSAKPGTEATTQAVLFTVHEAIGVGIGCIVAGLGFDSIGGQRTFLYASIFAVFTMVISVIIHLLVRRQSNSMNETTSTHM